MIEVGQVIGIHSAMLTFLYVVVRNAYLMCLCMYMLFFYVECMYSTWKKKDTIYEQMYIRKPTHCAFTYVPCMHPYVTHHTICITIKVSSYCSE